MSTTQGNCEYDVTILVQNRPSFASFNPTLKEIEIYTEDDTNIGNHPMQIIAKTSVPTDYNYDTYEEVETQIEVNIIIGMSCKSTILDSFEMSDMTIRIMDPQ